MTIHTIDTLFGYCMWRCILQCYFSHFYVVEIYKSGDLEEIFSVFVLITSRDFLFFIFYSIFLKKRSKLSLKLKQMGTSLK
jgi:hypothetical protein